ncbi:DUF3078 domain-containing protein [Prolixibacter sp. SD074]|uniref:DUF3078 domain-containing protein n=1 Tax=Prolixibacter sp. SD074 TaxID=2652391 RepID=UPI00128A904F|nr:DUF3078 domain-containing protein [Prolixibacter sp. SD074]GET27839.1 hypothetical protein SD074_00410 [Prolixibacter sp. SD074]GET31126.1 hypothetical protein SD074_33280 [Prolixibacter sp. SD074]
MSRIFPVLMLACIAMLAGPAWANTQGSASVKKDQHRDQLENPKDTLAWSVNYLNRIMYSGNEWYLTDRTYQKAIKGVLNYAENQPIDTSVVEMQKLLSDYGVVFIYDRRPQDIRHPENVPGYITSNQVDDQVKSLKKQWADSLKNSMIEVPESLLENIEKEVRLIPAMDPQRLLSDSLEQMPAAFRRCLKQHFASLGAADSISPAAFDSIRISVVESCRLRYNGSVLTSYRDSVIAQYRSGYIQQFIDSAAQAYREKVEQSNYDKLSYYNDGAVASANDSLRMALRYLTKYAAADSVKLSFTNLAGEKKSMWTANRPMPPIRFYLKNVQNDSLGVIVNNSGKGKVNIIIDDGVQIQRFTTTDRREIKIKREEPGDNLLAMNTITPKLSPWEMGGDGTLGFTQTTLKNWAKGGESSLAALGVAKYHVNYSKKKIKWENDLELRYGMNRTDTKGLQKNDDKIEFQSRLGYSAFNRWYYSGDFDFKTQMTRGYSDPDHQKPISAFMAPGYVTFSIGLDYKPNADFSLFISPLTSKTTYMNDTALIDPTNYGLKAGQKKLWEPGFIVKTTFKKDIIENIHYETAGQIFVNYRYPFTKFNFDWEQTLVLKVTRSINTRIMTHLIYDDNTKFPVYDNAGNQIGKKPKWQFQELFTVGFTYEF